LPALFFGNNAGKKFSISQILPIGVQRIGSTGESDFNFIQQDSRFWKEFFPKILDLKKKLTDIGS
jgi:hypothetical protein